MILGAEPKHQVIWIIRCKVMAPNKSSRTPKGQLLDGRSTTKIQPMFFFFSFMRCSLLARVPKTFLRNPSVNGGGDGFHKKVFGTFPYLHCFRNIKYTLKAFQAFLSFMIYQPYHFSILNWYILTLVP